MLGELFEDAKTKKEEKLEAEKAKKEANGTPAWFLRYVRLLKQKYFQIITNNSLGIRI